MAGKAAKVIITERQQETLQHLIRSPSTPQALVTRCRIVLLAFEKVSNQDMAQTVGLERHAVGLWRRRWRDGWEALIPEEFGSQAQLERAIARTLADDPRSGTTPKFTAEQVTQIIALACEQPEESGRPVTHWTPRELAEEAAQRGIVQSISTRQVGRFLKSGGVATASQ
jgi:putative transposase